jgi:predicted DNA-binding transcriptional regulator YafY
VSRVEGSFRSYRISRITDAKVLDEPSVTPTDFDLPAYWQESASTFKSRLPTYQAVFSVSPKVFPRLRFAGRFARVGETIETSDDGWITLSVGFDVEEIACEYALGFGSNLKVVAPDSLKKKVLEAASGVVEMYQAQRAPQ